MREELAGGVAAGVFDVDDLEGTMLAVLSLCIDLARWYEPAPEHSSAEAVGELYAGLVMRMLRPEPSAKQALGLVRSREGQCGATAALAGSARPRRFNGGGPDGDLMRISHRTRLARPDRAR